MIERKYYQRQLGEGFIHDSIDDCWEPWMKKADEILDDEELIDVVYEALQRRRPQSGTRGRKGTPAEVAMRMLTLKHMRNWSFQILEREVRSNLVYRAFTHVGAEKVPDAKTLARLNDARTRFDVRRSHYQHVNSARQQSKDAPGPTEGPLDIGPHAHLVPQSLVPARPVTAFWLEYMRKRQTVRRDKANCQHTHSRSIFPWNNCQRGARGGVRRYQP